MLTSGAGDYPSTSFEIESQTLRTERMHSSSEQACSGRDESKDDDLWALEYLFMICLLPTKKYSSWKWLYLNTFTCLHSCFVGYGGFLFILTVRVLTEGYVIQLFACVWNFSMASIYLILSYQQRQTPDLIERMRHISRPGSHPLLHWTGAFNFTRVCRVPVICAVLLWLVNVSFSLINARTLVEANFGLSDNIVFVIFAAYSSFHIHLLIWFVPVPIFFTACYYLSSKIKTVFKVFESEFRKDSEKGGDINLVDLTELYMEMYDLNRSLNHSMSLLFTFVNATMAVVFLFIILVRQRR